MTKRAAISRRAAWAKLLLKTYKNGGLEGSEGYLLFFILSEHWVDGFKENVPNDTESHLMSGSDNRGCLKVLSSRVKTKMGTSVQQKLFL